MRNVRSVDALRVNLRWKRANETDKLETKLICLFPVLQTPAGLGWSWKRCLLT